MNLKKASRSSLLLESSSDKSSVELKYEGETIALTVLLDEKNVELTKPGDYEYGDITLTCHEIPSESYLSVINIVKVGVEGLKLLFVSTQNSYSKEIVNNLANIDFVVSPFFSTVSLKKILADFEPQELIVLDDFELSETLSVEELKKSLGVQNVNEVGSIKVKASDSVQTKSTILSVSILK